MPTNLEQEMNFLQALALVGTAATILGVFLIGYAVINNKMLKDERRIAMEVMAGSREASIKRA